MLEYQDLHQKSLQEIDDRYHHLINIREHDIVNNSDDKTISNWLSLYKTNHSDATVYSVDSKNKMNSKYIVEKDSNKEAKSLEELKVIAPTVLKVNNGSITEYYEGETSVKEMLKK